MEKVSTRQLNETTKKLLLNIILRIDSISKEIEILDSKQVFSSDRIVFMLEDISVLIDALSIIEQNNSYINLEELTEKLDILYESMESKDKFMFRDIIELELKQLFEYWVENLDCKQKH